MLLASFRGRGAGIGGVVFAVVVIIDAAGVTLLLPLWAKFEKWLWQWKSVKTKYWIEKEDASLALKIWVEQKCTENHKEA